MQRLFYLLTAIVLLVPVINWLTADLRPTADLLDFLPPETPLVIDWLRPGDWGFLSRSKVLARGGERPAFLSQQKNPKPVLSRSGPVLARLLAACRQEAGQRACRDLAKGRVVLALLPEREGARELSDRLVLLARNNARRFLHRLFPGQHLSVARYQDVRVYRLAWPDGQELHAAQCGRIMLLGLSQGMVQRCLQRYWRRTVRPGSGFAGRKHNRIRRYEGPGLNDLFVHADGALLRQLASSHPVRSSLFWRKILGRIAALNVQSASLCHRFWLGTHFSSLVLALPDQAPLPSSGHGMRDPVRNLKFQHMPADLLFYFWTNLMDLQSVRRSSGRSPTSAELFGSIGWWLEQRTGMGIDEILDLFGSRFGCNIFPNQAITPLSVPRLCFCIEVKDREKMARFLEKIFAGLPVRRDAIGETEVVSVLAAGGLLQPSYALLANYLILADSRDQIEAVLAERAQRLVESPVFQAVDTGFSEPSNVLTFVRPAELVQGVRALLLWIEPLLGLQKPDQAAGSRRLLEEKVVPFLGKLELFKSATLRIYREPGRLVLKTGLKRR